MGIDLKRRDVVLSSALVLAPVLRARAQAPLRIGCLSVSAHPFIEPFRERLRQLGYVEGQTLVIEHRYAEGDAARLPALIDELVKSGVSILATSGSAATDAAVQANTGVPIVFVTSDPSMLGQVTSLARPGGIATGVSTMSEEIAPKKIELMRQAVPGLARLALLQDGSAGGVRQANGMAAAAASVGVETRVFDLAQPAAFERLLSGIAAERWQGVVAVSSPLFADNARVLAALVEWHRLPAMFDNPTFVHAGALMSFGPDLAAAFRRQAELVHRVARGSRVADIPIEQAVKFIIALNRVAATALGLVPSPLLMASVDELIE